MKAWILWTLNSARAWLHRFRWQHRAMAAYGKPPSAGSAVDRFKDNEEIPLKGVWWRVAKRVGGPEPVILLQPIAPTHARVKLVAAVSKKRRRAIEAQAVKARAAVAAAQRKDRATLLKP